MREQKTELNVRTNYGWLNTDLTETNQYLIPKVVEIVSPRKGQRLLDIGCGNGALARTFYEFGCDVSAVDVSPDGIALARVSNQHIHFSVASVYDPDFTAQTGTDFDYVVSLDVIEHLYWPSRLIEAAYRALKPGGCFIISTPYHGYLKNLALSVMNGWDRHFTANWDGGHIKFFSHKTLSAMLHEKGFNNITFEGLGRFPSLWKSMLLTATK